MKYISLRSSQKKKLELAGDFFALHIATDQQKMNNNKIKQSCYLTHAPEHCSLLVHQLFGWVQLHDPSLGQNHHPVVVEDGVQTVGNSYDCAKKNMIAFIVKHIYFQKLIIIIYKYPKFLKDDLLFVDFKLWVLFQVLIG